MRASVLCVACLLGAPFFGGCKGSGQIKTEADAKGELEAEVGGDAEGTGSAGAKQPGAKSGKGSVALAPPSGGPTATFPGFEVLPSGESLVTVQVRGPVEVTEQKAEGRLVYVLGGVAVPEKVNRLPLLTQHFHTQVTSVTLEQGAGGAQLIIELREPSTAQHKVEKHEGGSILTVTLPKSKKYGRTATSVGSIDDPASYERPADATDEDVKAADNDAIDDEDADVPEDASAETERRRRKSKRQPKRYVMRPLTLPYSTLAPDLAIAFGGQGRRNSFTYLTSGIRIGVVDWFEIEATPHSFRIGPASPAYAFPSLGVTLGYTGHVFEIAGRVRYFLGIDTGSTSDTGPGALAFGVPMAIHLGTWGRIDTGGFVSLDLESAMPGPGRGGDLRVGLFELQPSPFYTDYGFPLKFLFSPVEAFWFGVHHGFSIYDFDDPGETFALPLGGEIGIATSGDFNPVADLGFKVDFPEFITPGDGGDVLHEDTYEVGIWFRWYHHL